ncbi:MAG TPA: hypothetical protein VJL81_00745 [Solirubrobacterales bacterium]|nr:hypothetical protein [Solirubrobacterales bacterium]
MHGAVGEQGEDGGADVTAARSRPTSAAPGARAEAGTEIESPPTRVLLAATATGMARMAM